MSGIRNELKVFLLGMYQSQRERKQREGWKEKGGENGETR